jgi:hypothetical protein
MEASRTFRVPVGDLAARSGVPFTGVARRQAIPTRRSDRVCCDRTASSPVRG